MFSLFAWSDRLRSALLRAELRENERSACETIRYIAVIGYSYAAAAYAALKLSMKRGMIAVS
ncbi:hypothetical protein [Erythrobacter sp. MTPC3]|uniref:hypothetical protein n=1 Tax=Erythrobacter sp. MTPC3 TaxID=3056564 RepID=UPI0036F3C662